MGEPAEVCDACGRCLDAEGRCLAPPSLCPVSYVLVQGPVGDNA